MARRWGLAVATILYAKGPVAREGLLAFARRLVGQQGEEVAILAGKAVRGVVLGVVVTAFTQATIGSLGLFITGVPAATLLTAVMLILCLAQLGPSPVLIPSTICLFIGPVILAVTYTLLKAWVARDVEVQAEAGAPVIADLVNVLEA